MRRVWQVSDITGKHWLHVNHQIPITSVRPQSPGPERHRHCIQGRAPQGLGRAWVWRSSHLHVALLGLPGVGLLLHLLHLPAPDPGVSRRAPQHHHVARPPEKALGLLVVQDGQHRLGTGFGCAGHVVGQGTGELDL